MALDGFDPDFEDFPDSILKITERIWEGRDVGSIHRYYAPDCVVHTGMGSWQACAPWSKIRSGRNTRSLTA